ncbi:MAG: class I fructose-bisphosphate aldolase [Patescibacteria group bacterium]
MTYQDIINILGEQAEYYLGHICHKIPKDKIHATNPDHVPQIFGFSDRNERVVNNLQRLYQHGRLGGTGYLSILPVDQGIEHTAGYSFTRNPSYFNPDEVVTLAIEGGANGIASTLGLLGLVSKKYADKIPFIVKINHNELLTYPTKHDQILFGNVQQAYDMGAAGIGATIYFGSAESNRQIVEISQAFHQAHKLGLFTILWCYPRNPAWEKDGVNYETAADITGQAIHLGVTLEADIIKQKMPTVGEGMKTFNFGKYDDEMYQSLLTNHPIDMVRYQVANAYAGKIGLINSGGAYGGETDWREAVIQAVVNKRAGGAGLIMGRKIFNRPFWQGVELMRAVQDVYLEKEITLA